jgi:hypothetical protein
LFILLKKKEFIWSLKIRKYRHRSLLSGRAHFFESVHGERIISKNTDRKTRYRTSHRLFAVWSFLWITPLNGARYLLKIFSMSRYPVINPGNSGQRMREEYSDIPKLLLVKEQGTIDDIINSLIFLKNQKYYHTF